MLGGTQYIMAQRWLIAQKYEKETWGEDVERVLSQGYIQSKKVYAENIKAWFNKFIEIGDETKILQIGAAGEGMIFFFGVGDRYAIDPLADFYIKNFGVIQDRRVIYVKGVGEALPYMDNHFDIIILFNVLDHTSSPTDVLSEINRVLKSGGLLYLGVHTYSYIGAIYRIINEKLFKIPAIRKISKIDEGHPHAFTRYQLKKMIQKHFIFIDADHDEDYIGKDSSKKLKKLKRFLAGKKMYRFIVQK